MSDPPSTVQGGTVLGTGLPPTSYVAVLVASVLLFMWWGGPLWSAAPRSSHGMRFTLSYLSVIPLTAALLAVRRALTPTHWVAAVLTLWALKLVITAPLYYALAPGGALDEIDALPTHPTRASTAVVPARHAPSAARYHAATTPFAFGSVRGQAPADAVVRLLNAASGDPLGEGRAVTLTLSDRGFDGRVLLATTRDQLIIHNSGAALHTVQIQGVLNAPVPPGGRTQPIDLAEPDIHVLGCAAHAGEHGALVISDHPYATTSDADGGFELARVPAGPQRIEVIAWRDDALARHEQPIEVRADEAISVTLKLDDDPPKETDP